MRLIARKRTPHEHTDSYDQFVSIYILDTIVGCGCRWWVSTTGHGPAHANHAEHPGREDGGDRIDEEEASEADGVT